MHATVLAMPDHDPIEVCAATTGVSISQALRQQFPPSPKSPAKRTGSSARTAGIGSKPRRGAAPRGAGGNRWRSFSSESWRVVVCNRGARAAPNFFPSLIRISRPRWSAKREPRLRESGAGHCKCRRATGRDASGRPRTMPGPPPSPVPPRQSASSRAGPPRLRCRRNRRRSRGPRIPVSPELRPRSPASRRPRCESPR